MISLRATMFSLPGMITCEELESFVADYLDGRLPFTTRLKFRVHLLVCRDCRSYLKAFERSRALAKGALQADGTPEVPEMPADLVEIILKVSGGRGGRGPAP